MTDAWGIDEGFHDILGTWRTTPPETRDAIIRAMGGVPGSTPPEGARRALVLRAGEHVGLEGPAEVVLEDGTELRVEHELPVDLPLGYHQLRFLGDDASTRLIVSPGRCQLPQEPRAWGWAAQLYAARSTESWGIGDLADLRRLALWSASLGARFLLVNPLHAVAPVVPQQPSPYYPTSRRFRNVLYLRVDEVPGASASDVDLEHLAATGRALNDDRHIDRDAIFRLKLDALERLWSRFDGDPDFERYRTEQGQALETFATFCALAERYGGGWPAWPGEYRRPESPAVARFAAEHAGRVSFHAWLQWLLDRQLARAASRLSVMQDLPIGVDPGGADAWAWQDVLAQGASVGAPPDRYNAAGQDWGLPPFVPHRLVEAGYEPFIETIRATLRHAGGLRVDHVMGLFRLFWVPHGLTPAHGAYVRYPARELLLILALESARAGAVVVGEDLGTVEAGVRERLAEHAILSYRLVWFEAEAPGRYPTLALAAVTTHDLPTIGGLWTGADLEAQRRIGLEPNAEGFGEMRARVQSMTGVRADAPVPEIVEATYRALAQAPSMLVTATLDDALGVLERPNMPGTTSAWPNWSLALPAPLEALETSALARAIATALIRRAGEAD